MTERRADNMLNKKIFWLEDDHFHLKGLVRPLEDEGFTITPARSYKEAISIIDSDRNFDLVLLDLIIPYSEYLLEDIQSKNKLEREDGISNIAENGIAFFNYLVDV